MTQPTRKLSRHFRILKATADWIKVQPLGDILDSGVTIQKLPFRRNLTYAPGIYVTPTPESIANRNSGADWITYRAAVTCVSAPTNQNLTDEDQLNTHLLIRESLYDALLPLTDEALPGCSDIVATVTIEPGAIFDVSAFNAGYDVQQIIVACTGTKLRGTQNAA